MLIPLLKLTGFNEENIPKKRIIKIEIFNYYFIRDYCLLIVEAWTILTVFFCGGENTWWDFKCEISVAKELWLNGAFYGGFKNNKIKRIWKLRNNPRVYRCGMYGSSD